MSCYVCICCQAESITIVSVLLYIGYVQGMNDILSPLLLLFDSEHKAFWCFAEVIKRMVSNCWFTVYRSIQSVIMTVV